MCMNMNTRLTLDCVCVWCTCAENPVPFDFLIDGQFLRTTLEKHLADKGISGVCIYARPPLSIYVSPQRFTGEKRGFLMDFLGLGGLTRWCPWFSKIPRALHVPRQCTFP